MLVGPGVGMPLGEVISTMKDGFGNILKSLGFIIVLGTALGLLLAHTGSSKVMADFILPKMLIVLKESAAIQKKGLFMFFRRLKLKMP